MPRTSSFLGATAPWMTDSDDQYVYPQTRHMAAEQLRRALEARLAALLTADIDSVMLEIRKQIAECAVSGDITRAGDLGEVALDLLAAREHARGL